MHITCSSTSCFIPGITTEDRARNRELLSDNTSARTLVGFVFLLLCQEIRVASELTVSSAFLACDVFMFMVVWL